MIYRSISRTYFSDIYLHAERKHQNKSTNSSHSDIYLHAERKHQNKSTNSSHKQ